MGAGDDGGAELAAEGDTDDIGDDGGLELAAEGDEGADTGDAGLELAAGDEGADEGDAGLELAAADEGADDAGDAGLELASADEGSESDVSGLELAGDTDGGGSDDSGLEVAGDLGGGDNDSGGIELAGEGLEIASASGDDDDFLGIDPEQAALAEIAAQAAAEAGEDPNQAFEDVLSGAASLDDILETAAGGEDTGIPAAAPGAVTYEGFENSVLGFTSDSGGDGGLDNSIVNQVDTGGGTDNTTVVVEEVVTVVDTAVETLEVSATDASGTEDQAVALNIDASVSDATEQVQDIVISGVPAGAELSAGTDNGNGTWTLNQGDLVNLSITPAANSDQDFQLTVSVTAVETESGATATKTSALNVNVSGVADAPDLNVGQVTGLEDTSTPLNIGVNFVDTDGSETLEVTVIGVPTGATLSAGTDNGDGTWTLSEGDLAGLAITPPADFSGNFDLQVIAQTSEDGTVSNTVGEFNVNVVGTADAPVVTVTDAQGLEDNAIGLSIDVQLSDTDGSESITDITISGVPTGANLSAGTDNGDGTWTLTTADLTGLTVTPPLNSNDDIQLTVTAESSEIGDGSATAFSSFSVFITGVGDQPTVDVQPAAGNEDTVIPLDIQASLVDTDGSETIVSATITGVPDGATLSAGTDLGGGTWVLTPAELTGLNITPPADSNEDFDITVSATVQENDGATATTVTTLNVGLTDVADAPTVTVQGAAAQEDTAISLDITATLNDTDGSETITDITVSGVPTGASLSAGTDNGNGTWTLTTADLAGLTITPAADSNVDFSLTVSATSTEDDGDEITTVATLNVDVAGVADAPTVTVAPITGAEDSAIPLNIGVALVDTDGPRRPSRTSR